MYKKGKGEGLSTFVISLCNTQVPPTLTFKYANYEDYLTWKGFTNYVDKM